VRKKPRFRSLRGFTLVEMSLVLVVIGLIILTVFPALNAVRASTQTSLTNSNLQSLLRATAVYVQANGCLPCPTPASTVGNGFGRVRGDTNNTACNGCASPEGIPPFASLGIPALVAHDGWGRWITMRVDPTLTGGFTVVVPITGTTGICSNTLHNSVANSVWIQPPSGSTQSAAVIFVSHGANGYGAYVASASAGPYNGSRMPFPNGTPSCSNGGYEQCNAGDTTQFVNAPPVTGGNNPFDDVLLYLDRNNLVSLLGNSSCQTVW
jgi:prepilin-type N-terminal cleavage/methylation domain-containing protein